MVFAFAYAIEGSGVSCRFSGDGYTALDGTYWDSSFDGDANAYIVVFGSGAISSPDFYRAVDSEQKVRLILTF